MSNLKNTWECIAELRGHSSWIYGVPFIADDMLASVSGSEVNIWNIDTKDIDTILDGHTDTILSLSLSPNNQILASGSLDKTVGLWNLSTRDLICTVSKRKDPIHSVAFSPDGKFLASGGANKYKTDDGKKTTIYLWSSDGKELIRTFLGHDLRVNTLTFSPNCQLLASGSNDNTVRIWDIYLGKQLHILEGHSKNIGTVAFTPDGNTLISSGGGGVKIWDVETGKLQQTFAEQAEYVRCFAIHTTGQILAIESHDGIEIWDLKKREILHYLDFRWPISMNFSADGKLFASGDATAFTEDGGLIKVWRVPNIGTIVDPNDLEIERKELEVDGYFNPENLEDARQRIVTSIVQRQGQAKFRRELLKTYDGRCPITGCDVESAIEAAHIIPYSGTETNHPSNGLPLRADIHVLFDLHLLSIKPDTYDVVIASDLYGTCYEELADRKLNLPHDKNVYPNQTALQKHHDIFLNKR